MKRKQSVAHTHKDVLSLDLLLKMGAKTMSPEELSKIRRQKETLQTNMQGIEEDDKNDAEVLARRKRFQADDKVYKQ